MRVGILLAASIFMAAHTHATEQNEPTRLERLYEKSIKDAGIIEPDEIVPIKTLTETSGQFVTWTSYPDSYTPGQDVNLSWGETWVTLNGAVQKKCTAFPKKKLNLRIQQLLGLPPQADANRFFVVLEVQTKDMFRPCANPSLTETTCSPDFDKDATEAHKAWYAGQSAASYQDDGYPWTRLGYTYNWHPKSSEVGLSEFVINKGSNVKVISVTPTAQYCN